MPAEPHRRRQRLSRIVRALAAVGGVVLATYGVAVALLSVPAVQTRVRGRVVEALRTELGCDVALDGDVRLDPLVRLSFGPLTVRAPAEGLPSARVERVAMRPRIRSVLAGRVDPVIAFRRLAIVATGRGEELELGPVDGELTRERDREEERIAVDVRLPGGGRAALAARRATGAAWDVHAAASGLGPDLLPAGVRGGDAEIARGSVSIEAEGAAAPDLASAEGRLRVVATDLVIAGERIAPGPVGPLHGEVDATVRWDGRGRRLSVSDGRVSLLGAIRAAAEADVRFVPGLPFSVSLRADGLDFASAVAALPEALAPPPAAPRPGGTLDARAAVAGPLLAPPEWALTASLDVSRMRSAARAAPPVKLRAPFVYAPAPGVAGPAIVVGPSNANFVPIAELPVHVVRAVTTSEDGGFFAHPGFDFSELRNALAEDAAAGRVVRGGSTITQQLAKNLYLTGEKTLARKVREAVITVALEATVPKQRLLEIYLNVVEWGPGIRGIGPAARYWFGKDARALTPIEAAFLASVIPNPTRYGYMRARGAVSEAWRRRIDDVLLKMAQQGVLREDDLARALAEPVVFARG